MHIYAIIAMYFLMKAKIQKKILNILRNK